MLKLIGLIICQFILVQVSISQDHVKELARKTWMDYIETRNQKDELEKQLRTNTTIIKNLEKNAEKDFDQIHELNKKRDELIKKLRRSQSDYLKSCAEVKKAYDSIQVLKNQNTELTGWVDSFSIALKEEKIVREQLSNEKKQMEKLLFFKIKDLEIAELENSYFTNFDVGYKKGNREIIYSENSKDQNTRPIFNSLEYLRFTGSVYTPPGIDSLDGFILLYKDDILYNEIPLRFVAETKTRSYNHFDISKSDLKLNKKIKPRSNLEIAFVTGEIYHTNREKIKNFNESYYSGLFVLAIRPELNSLTSDNYLVNSLIDSNEIAAIKDSFNTNGREFKISICNDFDFSGEYGSLSINDSLINQSIKLMPYQFKFSCNYKFKEGLNFIKLKALSISNKPQKTNCRLWLYLSTIAEDKIIYKKSIVLKKGDVFGLYIQNKL